MKPDGLRLLRAEFALRVIQAARAHGGVDLEAFRAAHERAGAFIHAGTVNAAALAAEAHAVLGTDHAPSPGDLPDLEEWYRTLCDAVTEHIGPVGCGCHGH